MPAYVTLINCTRPGGQGLRGHGRPGSQAEEAMGALGTSFKDIYWTLGSYDIVAVREAPDDESATAALLAVAAPHHHASRLRP